MTRLLIALLLFASVLPAQGRGRSRIVRQRVYTRPGLRVDPCGVNNTSPGCQAAADTAKAQELRRDYEMVAAQTADCLARLSKHKVLMGRDALPNYPAPGAPLDSATRAAIVQRNACEQRMKQVPDTTEKPPEPYVQPRKAASQKRISVKKP